MRRAGNSLVQHADALDAWAGSRGVVGAVERVLDRIDAALQPPEVTV